MLLKNAKEDNQYYGKLFEAAVVAQLNKEPLSYSENYEFSDEEKQELLSEAKIVADYLAGHTAVYTGNHTGLASGDILLDSGENVELKRVSFGAGTYFNTSIYYFEKFGFNFKDYMHKYGLYEALENTFGSEFKISRKNNSPVSQPNSSLIRHNYEELYKENIVPVDLYVRQVFTQDLVNYFTNNLDKVYEFISDMLSKNSATSKKSSPDRLIVFNYKKEKVKEINLKDFQENVSTNIRATDTGFIVGNVRVALSWQNGVGLNNPTIRVFLED